MREAALSASENRLYRLDDRNLTVVEETSALNISHQRVMECQRLRCCKSKRPTSRGVGGHYLFKPEEKQQTITSWRALKWSTYKFNISKVSKLLTDYLLKNLWPTMMGTVLTTNSKANFSFSSLAFLLKLETITGANQLQLNLFMLTLGPLSRTKTIIFLKICALHVASFALCPLVQIGWQSPLSTQILVIWPERVILARETALKHFERGS